MSFAKNVVKSIGKNISKNLSGKYSHKLLDHAKESATHALKSTSKRVILKTEEATGDLIGTKIANRIMKETFTSEHDKETSREIYTSPEERQKIIDDLRLI